MTAMGLRPVSVGGGLGGVQEFLLEDVDIDIGRGHS